MGLERLAERRGPRVSLRGSSALHLDGDQASPSPHDEVHLPVPIVPIEQVDLPRRGRIGQMGTDGGFYEASPRTRDRHVPW